MGWMIMKNLQSKILRCYKRNYTSTCTYLKFDRLAVHNEVGELPGNGVLLAPFLRLGARLELVLLQEHVQGTEGMICDRTPKNAESSRNAQLFPLQAGRYKTI